MEEARDKLGRRTRRNFTFTDQMAVIEKVKAGMTVMQAAREFGITRNLLYKWIELAGIDMPPRKVSNAILPAEKRTAFYAMVKQGMTYRSAALAAGVNPNTAYSWLRNSPETQKARELGQASLWENRVIGRIMTRIALLSDLGRNELIKQIMAMSTTNNGAKPK